MPQVREAIEWQALRTPEQVNAERAGVVREILSQGEALWRSGERDLWHRAKGSDPELDGVVKSANAALLALEACKAGVPAWQQKVELLRSGELNSCAQTLQLYRARGVCLQGLSSLGILRQLAWGRPWQQWSFPTCRMWWQVAWSATAS